MNIKRHSRKRKRFELIIGLMLVLLASYFYWIRYQMKNHEVAFETIELAQAPSEVMEVIKDEAGNARKFEVLSAEHEGWVYVYYGIDELEYSTIDVKLMELKKQYLAEIIVFNAASEEWINSYKLVRFQLLSDKPLLAEVKDDTRMKLE
ncbi:hypothetical protein [Paenibacillus illinoisensis]|uniref:hypothetical protein n=1 Tax=Paenibacillus illinoisensis TaxID=59845 RepID=UPI00203D1AB9|nr:hypothetical protein [Paenibacillus illinoisensis]MCM3203919.1 hypothetical protein [Paenibacillus illinoisensis]